MTIEQSEEKKSVIKDSMLQRYKDISEAQMRAKFKPKEIRKYSFSAVMALIEQHSDITREEKNEMEFHFLQFMRHNEE